jgi:hypothetical protein
MRLESALPSAPTSKREVAELRHRAAEGFEDFDLHAGVRDVVFAADDVGDLEVDVVDDAGQRVEEGAVFADEDGIAERGGVDGDVAADEIVPVLARAGELEAPVRLAAFGFELGAIFSGELQRSAVVNWRLARRLRDLAAAIEFVLGLVRRIEQPCRFQLVGGFFVLGEAMRLVGALAPVEAEPREVVDDACSYSLVERARSVSSMRKRTVPPCGIANSQFINAVRTLPTWMRPVGDGAKRRRMDIT